MRQHRVRLVLSLIGALVLALMIGFAAVPTQAQIVGTNWTGTFYNSLDLSGTPAASNVPYPTGLCANWGNNQPTAGSSAICVPGETLSAVNADNFSARFDSTQTINAAGEYRFTLRYNDGMRMFIDGVQVFNDFDQNPPDATGNCANICKESTFVIDLTAGSHTFQVDYVEYTGNAILQVQWGFVGGPSTPITPTFIPTLMTPTPQPSNELIDNGGFEGAFVGDWTGEQFPWEFKNVTGDKIKCSQPFDKQVALTGDCAFRFKGGGAAGQPERSSIQQTIDLNGVSFAAGDNLAFSLWANAKQASVNASAKLTVKYSDGTAKSKRKLPISQTSGYAQLTDSLPLDSTAVQQIKVGVGNRSASGSLFVDQVSLLVVNSGVTPTPTATMTGTPTITPSVTLDLTAQVTLTGTFSPTATHTLDPNVTPTVTETPTSTVDPLITPSNTPGGVPLGAGNTLPLP
jgi:hypothetical protein